MLRRFREALACPRAPPGNNNRSAIRSHNAVILDAEYRWPSAILCPRCDARETI